MANWVTLPNGVHIDLDDPNNPLTGDGTFESYLGGGDKGSGSKGSTKGWQKTKMASGTLYEKGSLRIMEQTNLDSNQKEYRISGTDKTFKSLEEAENYANKSSKGEPMSGKDQNTPEQDDGFMEWYNSLSEQDRASIDRQMHADKEVGAKYGFTPTKQTIWNDKSHPLYGIAPSEQDEDYLKSAISEMSRYSNRWSSMSKSEKNEISPNGKVALDNKIKQYSKALDYIKSFK